MSPAAPTEQVPTSTYAYRVPGGEVPGEENPQGPRKRGWLRWVVLLVLLALAGLITWRTITAKREEQATAARRQRAMASQAIPVQVAAVRQETVPIYLTGLGTITPYYSVKIIPRVTGELTNVYFREGQEVRKGAELMTIDPRPYQATLDQAKGQLARDEAQLKNNQAEFNRYKALYDQGVVSKEQLDTYESNLGQFVGAIKSDQAAIESAQLNVTYCHIKSPIDGKVGLRQVDPGNLITANTTQTLVVNQFRPIAVYFTLPEDQLQRVLDKLRRDHKLDAIAFDRSDTTQLETRSTHRGRQPDRCHDRHGQAEGRFRQHRREALPQPVRECSSRPGAAREFHGGAGGGGPAQSGRRLRMAGQAGIESKRRDASQPSDAGAKQRQ